MLLGMTMQQNAVTHQKCGMDASGVQIKRRYSFQKEKYTFFSLPVSPQRHAKEELTSVRRVFCFLVIILLNQEITKTLLVLKQ